MCQRATSYVPATIMIVALFTTSTACKSLGKPSSLADANTTESNDQASRVREAFAASHQAPSPAALSNTAQLWQCKFYATGSKVAVSEDDVFEFKAGGDGYVYALSLEADHTPSVYARFQKRDGDWKGADQLPIYARAGDDTSILLETAEASKLNAIYPEAISDPSLAATWYGKCEPK